MKKSKYLIEGRAVFMKKILAGMLAGAMVLGALTGCSGGKQETQGPAAEGTATTAAAEAGDGKKADSGETKTGWRRPDSVRNRHNPNPVQRHHPPASQDSDRDWLAD